MTSNLPAPLQPPQQRGRVRRTVATAEAWSELVHLAMRRGLPAESIRLLQERAARISTQTGESALDVFERMVRERTRRPIGRIYAKVCGFLFYDPDRGAPRDVKHENVRRRQLPPSP